GASSRHVPVGPNRETRLLEADERVPQLEPPFVVFRDERDRLAERRDGEPGVAGRLGRETETPPRDAEGRIGLGREGERLDGHTQLTSRLRLAPLAQMIEGEATAFAPAPGARLDAREGYRLLDRSRQTPRPSTRNRGMVPALPSIVNEKMKAA